MSVFTTSPPENTVADLEPIFDYALVPLEDDAEPDADNSILGMYPNHALPDRLGAPAATTFTTPNRRALVKVVGPLRREIRAKKVPMRGTDIVAIKRALSHAKIMPWSRAFTPVAGWFFFVLLKKFQKKHGLKADGVYGPATHKALAKYFDAWGIKLYQSAKIGLKGAALKRQQFRAHCLFLYHMRDRIHYTMGPSRMSIIRRYLKFENVFSQGDLYEDCSSIGKGMFKWIDVPDPNGFGYNSPLGYTGTMTNTGRTISYGAPLKIADAFLTGYYPYHHTWYYYGDGIGFSHGKEADPRFVPWNYCPVNRIQRYIKEDA